MTLQKVIMKSIYKEKNIMKRRVIITIQKKENKDNIVYLNYNGDHPLLELIRTAQRMAPDKIIIQNPDQFPKYKIQQAIKYTERLKDICPKHFFCFR